MTAMRRRRVAVVGAGVVGVSTAYVLARDGYEVTLIDRRPTPGGGASAANAAQLSWAYGDAMASPALLRQLPSILCGRDPAFRFEWRIEPAFLLWGLRFLLNTPYGRWWDNTAHILELAEISRREMDVLQKEVDLSFAYRAAGKLHLYADNAGFDSARRTVGKKRSLGIGQDMISREEAIRIEPGLKQFRGEIAGAIHTPGDAVGDASAFCGALTDHMVRQHGVTVIHGHTVAGFGVPRQGSLKTVRFQDREDLETDFAVAACGPETSSLIGSIPEARAINPVRGYSLTISVPEGAPSVSLTDVKRKLAFARIGNAFRVAGLADIVAPASGFDTNRIGMLRDVARSVFPDFFAGPAGAVWSGERPMTPSSRPIIAPSRHIKGLYLNIGHGMLGWTLSLGSARRLANMISTSAV